MLPIGLDKGVAVSRLKERLQIEGVICAGDSELDAPMLEAADIAVAPKSLRIRSKRAVFLDDEVFSRNALSAVYSEVIEKR